ncbi:unnamed protein product [Rhizoctonia solani]|uniref:Uncharacterized protein n=1 Tax=Rhizoctonia solani TaxID=456999 RepID=A0A8H3H6Y8_9AGAM|nr:unnamed protein product [Rhizoctonia solani]
MTSGVQLPPTVKEIIPSGSRRYEDRHAGQAKRRIIPIGPLDVKEGDNIAAQPLGPVPYGWVELTHVIEGKPFFYNPRTRVITDAYIRMPDILSRVETYYGQINRVIESLDLDSIELELSTMDIYIDPICDPETGHKVGTYYLVDHYRQSIAFLRQVNTGDVGLPDVRSNIHLERVLKSEYWTHCEYMPRPDVDHTSSARKLQGQLASLMIDHISSEGSTSPFTPEECEHYLKGVNPENNEPQFLNWSVARVNSLLIQSQIINLHGERCARADRMMVVTGQRPPTRTARYLQLSKLMFDCPVTHLNRLEQAWTDRIIYSHHWKKLLGELNEEWVAAAGTAGLVWIANMILFTSSSSVLVLLLLGVSTVSTVYGVAKSLLLIRKHRSIGQYAVHASQYLQANEKYGTGLQDLSIEYSCPWVCALWAGALTSVGVLCTILGQILGSVLGLVQSVGFVPSYFLSTGMLMVGAWAYGGGATIGAQKIVSPTKQSTHVPYIIRTK